MYAPAMGIGEWWKRLWASPVESPPADPDAPAVRVGTIELAPGLRSHEYHHALIGRHGAFRVRTLLTEGLAALGSPEVTVTVPASWGNDELQPVLALYEELARGAAAGAPVRLLDSAGFQTGAIAGGRPVGLVYARGTSVRGIPCGGDTLAAVLLHREEHALVRRGHATRVLGLLAARALRFPYPAWWEVRDEPVLRESEQRQSALERAGDLPRLGDARVTLVDGRTLVVSLPPGIERKFAAMWEALPELDGVPLHAALAPDADAQMIWFPRSGETTATTAGVVAPTRIGYAFALFFTDHEEDAFRAIEDGVGVLLTAASFARLRSALVAGNDLTLPLGEEITLQLTFRPQSLVDPMTGQAMVAPGGWERFEPKGGPRAATGRVAVKGIILLVTEVQLAERVESAALAGFVEAAEGTLERLAVAYPVAAPVPVAMEFTLAPGCVPRVKIAWQGDAEPELLGPLHAALAELAPVPVRGEVAFQLEATVHAHPLTN